MIAFISFIALLVGIVMSAFGHMQSGRLKVQAGKRLFSVGIGVSVVALAGVAWGVMVASPPSPSTVVTDFASCAAAGNPVMESYPEMCRTSDGRTFTNSLAVAPKLQSCPEKWYINKMPAGTDAISQEYFIYSGKRVEQDRVDVEWVKKNCSTKAPEEVH